VRNSSLLGFDASTTGTCSEDWRGNHASVQCFPFSVMLPPRERRYMIIPKVSWSRIVREEQCRFSSYPHNWPRDGRCAVLQFSSYCLAATHSRALCQSLVWFTLQCKNTIRIIGWVLINVFKPRSDLFKPQTNL
jgi:hypothetical protein